MLFGDPGQKLNAVCLHVVSTMMYVWTMELCVWSKGMICDMLLESDAHP